jgi:hypothetical protein
MNGIRKFHQWGNKQWKRTSEDETPYQSINDTWPSSPAVILYDEGFRGTGREMESLPQTRQFRTGQIGRRKAVEGVCDKYMIEHWPQLAIERGSSCPLSLQSWKYVQCAQRVPGRWQSPTVHHKLQGLLKRCGDDSIKYAGSIGAFEASEMLVAAIVRRW